MGTAPRLGIIDMGSNAIRLLIAEVTAAGELRIVESQRQPVRLGGEVFDTGRIPAGTIAATVEALRQLRAECTRFDVQRIHAIATSAMRAADNRDVLIERVRTATGIQIEVISGKQEANLLALGVASRLDLSRGRSLLVDVGGGSVEVTIVEHGVVAASGSHPLGALRLLQAFAANDSGESFAASVRRQLAQHDQQILDCFDGRGFDRYAAVGGTIECLADIIAGDRRDDDGDGVIELAAIEAEVARLLQLSVEERMQQHNLRPDRADTIVPAGMIYTHLGRLAGIDQVHVSRTGIKEGLLVAAASGDLASPEPGPTPHA